MKSRKIYRIEAVRQPAGKTKRTVRKQLNADALIQLMREDFQKIPDHRDGNAKISLDDALMSALAMFNTLKNQGYNLGHNYGLGEKNLSAVFAILMMLAFLLDQIQQMSCWLFQEALQKSETKRYMWEGIRVFFYNYRVDSMETILRAIAHGFERRELKECCS